MCGTRGQSPAPRAPYSGTENLQVGGPLLPSRARGPCPSVLPQAREETSGFRVGLGPLVSDPSAFPRCGRRQSGFRVSPGPLVSDPGLRLNAACPVWARLGPPAEGWPLGMPPGRDPAQEAPAGGPGWSRSSATHCAIRGPHCARHTQDSRWRGSRQRQVHASGKGGGLRQTLVTTQGRPPSANSKGASTSAVHPRRAGWRDA